MNHSRKQLIHMLTEAAEIEHNLLCSYLYAMFSLKPAGAPGFDEREKPSSARASMAHQYPPRLEDIARYKLIVLPHQSATRKVVDNVFGKAGVETRDMIEAGNCRAAREFAEQSVGVALVHSLSVGQLRYVDLRQQFGQVDFRL